MFRSMMNGGRVALVVAAVAVALMTTDARAGHRGSRWSVGYSSCGPSVSVSYGRPYVREYYDSYRPAPCYSEVVYARPAVTYVTSCDRPVYRPTTVYRSYGYDRPRVVYTSSPRVHYSRPSYSYGHGYRGDSYRRHDGGVRVRYRR